MEVSRNSLKTSKLGAKFPRSNVWYSHGDPVPASVAPVLVGAEVQMHCTFPLVVGQLKTKGYVRRHRLVGADRDCRILELTARSAPDDHVPDTMFGARPPFHEPKASTKYAHYVAFSFSLIFLASTIQANLFSTFATKYVRDPTLRTHVAIRQRRPDISTSFGCCAFCYMRQFGTSGLHAIGGCNFGKPTSSESSSLVLLTLSPRKVLWADEEDPLMFALVYMLAPARAPAFVGERHHNPIATME